MNKTKLDKIFKLLEASNNDNNDISENMIITKYINNSINDLTDETGGVFDNIRDLPYFSPEEIDNLKGYYAESEMTYLDDNKTIKMSDWKNNYKLLYHGIISDNNQEYIRAWVNKITSLFYDINKAYMNMDTEEACRLKQYMLDLGWNPNSGFDPITRVEVDKRVRAMLKDKYNKDIYNISEFIENYKDNEKTITESSLTEPDKYPLYIVLTYTGTGFGKVINTYTHGVYSHAALSLDADMTRLYSFNVADNGFSVESIKGYEKQNKDSTMVIYTIFINKKDLLTIKTKLDYFLLNKKKTKYSILNILGLLINKPVELANDMICSQFVDFILKTIDIDITNKHSGLVTPNDLYMSLNPNIYKLYEGKVSDYDYKKMEALKNVLVKKVKNVNESMDITNESTLIESICNNKDSIPDLLSLLENNTILSENNEVIIEHLRPYIDIDCVKESKEFPVQFDNDGNLLIKKIQTIDYDYEYFQSHKLLKIYEDNHNIEGMKYELSKLWFLNNLLEKKIYSESDKTVKDSCHKSRSRILNDFNKYLKIVNKEDKDFSFTNYYNNSPFSDATIKINSSTLHHGGKLLKNISKMMLH